MVNSRKFVGNYKIFRGGNSKRDKKEVQRWKKEYINR